MQQHCSALGACACNKHLLSSLPQIGVAYPPLMSSEKMEICMATAHTEPSDPVLLSLARLLRVRDRSSSRRWRSLHSLAPFYVLPHLTAHLSYDSGFRQSRLLRLPTDIICHPKHVGWKRAFALQTKSFPSRGCCPHPEEA